jgi:uncharacterized protein
VSRFPFRSALVTGASSGIGAEFVHQLAADGVTVVAVARRRERLEALAAQHCGVEVLAADLATDDGVAAVAARLRSRPIELLVNNAGFGTGTPLVQSDEQRSADEVAVNVLALTRLTKAAVDTMVPAGRGWIVNVSSVAGFFPVSSAAVYAATKAYVTSFSVGLSQQLAGTGVLVSALCPGYTRTEFHSVSSPGRDLDVPAALWKWPDEVVRDGLDGLVRGLQIVTPGKLNRVAATLGIVLSPKLVAAAASRLDRRHQ